MKNSVSTTARKRMAALGIGVGVLVGTAGLANALSNRDAAPAATDAVPSQTDDDDATDADEGSERMAEEELTGQLAADVTDAAETAVPGGTVDKVETNGNGDGYEAYVTDTDGNPIKIYFDLDLNVVTQQAGNEHHGEEGHGRHGGFDGHGPGGMAEEELTGQIAADVTDVAETAVPGGTVDKVETHGDLYEAYVTDTDGNPIKIYVDLDLNVVTQQAGHAGGGEGDEGTE